MAAPDRPQTAVVVIIATVFALALGDALIKGTSATFTLWQVFVLRSLVVAPILIWLIRRNQADVSLLPHECFWTVLRSVMLALMWVLYYFSLAHVALSTAAATYYTLPFFITIFAAMFLGDSIGRLGWCAVVVGFVGVILVLEPRTQDFNWYALLPLMSAVLYALSMILTRSKCRDEHILVLSLWLNVSMLGLGAIASIALWGSDLIPEIRAGQPFVLGSWAALGTNELIALGVLSLAILVGSVGAAYAYQNGRPATIATFDFAYVAFAVVWGIAIFSEELSARAFVGIALIVAAGVLAVRSNTSSDDAPEES